MSRVLLHSWSSSVIQGNVDCMFFSPCSQLAYRKTNLAPGGADHGALCSSPLRLPKVRAQRRTSSLKLKINAATSSR
jgi:hypothetical protein